MFNSKINPKTSPEPEKGHHKSQQYNSQTTGYQVHRKSLVLQTVQSKTDAFNLVPRETPAGGEGCGSKSKSRCGAQSIAGILDPGNSRENQLDFFSLDHEK